MNPTLSGKLFSSLVVILLCVVGLVGLPDAAHVACSDAR